MIFVAGEGGGRFCFRACCVRVGYNSVYEYSCELSSVRDAGTFVALLPTFSSPRSPPAASRTRTTQQIAQKTAAEQLCRTLLVSDKARVTVMPSMEIIANDVTCTHGATICDLEDEELFYLMTRGISKIQVWSGRVGSVGRYFVFVLYEKQKLLGSEGRKKKKKITLNPQYAGVGCVARFFFLYFFSYCTRYVFCIFIFVFVYLQRFRKESRVRTFCLFRYEKNEAKVDWRPNWWMLQRGV